MDDKDRPMTALGLVATALAWPTAAGALISLTLTPYERALKASWCGGPLHESFVLFHHCAACWVGSAMLILLALVVASEPGRRAARAIAPYSRRR